MLVIVLAAVLVALDVGRIGVAHDGVMPWDQAEHGLDGVRLAQAVRAGAGVDFARHLHRMSLWPPVFPLLELPAFLVFGDRPAVATGVMAALLLAAALALLFAAAAAGRGDPVAGPVAAGLFLLSPMTALYGALVMLEMPGALVQALALGSYLRSLDAGGCRPAPGAQLRNLRLACVSLTVLFLCKYNYGLVLGAGLVAAEVAARGRVRELAAAIRRVPWRRPFVALVAVYAGLLAALVVTGGGVLELSGQRLSVRSVGNPAYFLLVIVAARLALAAARDPARARAAWAALDERLRALLALVVAPCAAWLLVPPHGKDFFNFLHNRSSGLPLLSAPSLLFYPRSFVYDYAPAPWLGVAVLAVAAGTLVCARRLGPATRAVAIVAAVSWLAATLHPFKEARFLFTTAPLVWLLAARGTGGALARLRPQHGWPHALRAGLAVAIAGGAAWRGVDAGRLARGLDRHSLPAATARVADRVVELAGEYRDSVLLGYCNGFSPALVEWRCRLADPGPRPGCVPRRPRATDAAGIVATGSGLILAVEPAAGAAATAGVVAENPWLPATAAALAVRPGLDLVADQTDAAAGLRLRAWRLE